MTTTAPRQTDSSTRPVNAVLGMVRAMRPRQWVKNVLVLAAPFAGGFLFQLHVLIAICRPENKRRLCLDWWGARERVRQVVQQTRTVLRHDLHQRGGLRSIVLERHPRF